MYGRCAAPDAPSTVNLSSNTLQRQEANRIMSRQYGPAAPRKTGAGCEIGPCRVAGDSELRLLAPGQNGAITGMRQGPAFRHLAADQSAAQITRLRDIVAVFS